MKIKNISKDKKDTKVKKKRAKQTQMWGVKCPIMFKP
jgi:hypothetical protein